jgi:hypothetical protein
MWKKIVFMITLSFLLFNAWYAITDPIEKFPDIDLYLETPGLVRETPSRFYPQYLNSASRDIAFWKKVLPYEEDRYADMYMVIPQLWLVTPIQQIPRDSGDWSNMIDWREIGINKYLQWGIIEYAWSTAPWYLWKRIDFWHSNYFTKDAWRYKTIFANLMWLDPGDEVWYFVRNGDDYDLFVYEVTASYPTSPKNTSALHYDWQWADALIFGCYHGLDWRWMVEATYIGDPLWNTVKNNVDLPLYRKQRIDSAIIKLWAVPLKWRKQYIAYFFSRITQFENNYGFSPTERAVTDYMLEKMSDLYE